MPKKRSGSKETKEDSNNAVTVGYEAQLWKMADALRGGMNAAAKSCALVTA
jgi:hypothetical protein